MTEGADVSVLEARVRVGLPVTPGPPALSRWEPRNAGESGRRVARGLRAHPPAVFFVVAVSLVSGVPFFGPDSPGRGLSVPAEISIPPGVGAEELRWDLSFPSGVVSRALMTFFPKARGPVLILRSGVIFGLQKKTSPQKSKVISGSSSIFQAKPGLGVPYR